MVPHSPSNFKNFMIDMSELASEPWPKYSQDGNKSRTVQKGAESYNPATFKMVYIKTSFLKKEQL